MQGTNVPVNPVAWYDVDTIIPYLTTFRANQARALDHKDIARWMKAPVIR